MRIPLLYLFVTSPFEGLQEHAEKVKECTLSFQQAIECHISRKCQTFQEFRNEVNKLEEEADKIKRRIRGHLPKGTLLPVDKFQLFRYLREQDHVLDAVQDTLDWISFRPEPGIPEELEKDFANLVDAVIRPIEALSEMVAATRSYFRTFSEKDRNIVKGLIRNVRKHEHDADKLEDALKMRIFAEIEDAVTIFHMVRLSDNIGSVADHAENACDMMRAMIAK